jgi:hypothetical protein
MALGMGTIRKPGLAVFNGKIKKTSTTDLHGLEEKISENARNLRQSLSHRHLFRQKRGESKTLSESGGCPIPFKDAGVVRPRHPAFIRYNYPPEVYSWKLPGTDIRAFVSPNVITPRW